MNISLLAQSPGQVFQPANGDGRLILDPNGDGFVSASGNVFSPNTQDYGSASEIGYHALPVLIKEIEGDPRTGGSHTDLIGIISGSYEDPGAFLFNDGTNLLFRQRLISYSSASKGYSFLFDTNLNGRPDYEVILRTGGGQAGISIYNSSGTRIHYESNLSNHFQKAVAAVVDGDPTYFYDWYLPWNTLPFNPGQNFRVIATTVTSATGGYLSGGTLADIGGIDDSEVGDQDVAVNILLGAQPTSNGNSLEEGGGFGNLVTTVPSIFSPVFDDQTSVSGTSVEAEGTTITLRIYANPGDSSPISTSTATVNATGSWTVTGLSLNAGQILGATANASGKSVSAESNRITVRSTGESISCTPAPNAFGRQGNTYRVTISELNPYTGSINDITIRLYTGTIGNLTLFASTDPSELGLSSQSFTPGLSYDAGNQRFELTGNGGNPWGNTDYFVTAQITGECESEIGLDGVNRTEAPVITTSTLEPISSQTISGTSTEANGTIIQIFRNDDNFEIGNTTVSGGTWSTTISAVSSGDEIYARATRDDINAITSSRSNVVTVGNKTEPPVITGQYTSGFSGNITGYTIGGGQNVRVFRNGVLLGDTDSNAFGVWELDLSTLSPVVSLSAGDELTANAQAGGESRSDLSDIVTVSSVASPPSAPTVNSPIRAGDTSISASGTSGTTEFFADGESIGTTTGSSITLSSADASLYILQGVEITATNTSNGLTSEHSAPVIVQASNTVGGISVFAIPVQTVAGNTSTVTATVSDQFGSPMESQSVTFSIQSGAGNFSSSNPVTTNSFGQATISYVTSSTVEESVIRAESAAFNDDVTIQTVAGPAVEIVTFTINDSSINNSEQTSVTATVHDINGNPVPNVNVTFSSNNGSLATVSTSPVSTNSSGVSQTTINSAASGDGSVTISASISSSDSNVSENDSKSVQLNVGTPASISAQHSTLTPVLSTITADGTSTQVLTVTARDGGGDPIGTGGETVTITRASGTGDISAVTDNNDGTYTATVTAPANLGSGVFVATLGGEEVRSGTGSQTEATVNFVAGMATQISSLTIADASIDLDGSTTVTATVLDAHNNPVEGVTVSFSSDQTNRATVAASAVTNAGGQAVAAVSGADDQAGAVVITASINDADGNVATSDSETVGLAVQAGAATRLVITGNASQTAGEAQSLTITARDNAGNVITAYDGERTITFSGPADSPNDTSPTITNKNGSAIDFGEDVILDFSNGIATVSGSNNGRMILYRAETVFITASDGTITSSGADRLEVTVSASSGHTIAIENGNNQSATAGTELSTNPAVRVTDQFGNPVSGVEVTFAVASGGGSLDGSGTISTNASGIAESPSWTLGSTAGNNTMTATSSGLSGSPITFTATGTAGGATQLVFTQQPVNTVSTEEITPAITVEFRDVNNNLVSTTNNVTLAIENNAATGSDGELSGTKTRAASGGVATFTALSIDKMGTGYTLKASSGSLEVISSAFDIQAGAPVANQTTAVVPNGTAGEATTITITVRDGGGNPISGQQGNLVISFNEGPNSGASFSSITDNGNGIYTVSYTPTVIGDDIIAITLNGTAINSSPFTSTVSAGTVASFAVERSGGGDIQEQTAGQEFTIRVRALDGSGNVVAGFNGTADLTLNHNSFETGGGTTANFVNGVLTSHTVQINNAATGYQITATQSGSSESGISNTFNVVPASGNKIVITTQPVGAASGSELNTQPVVEIQDELNNRVTSFTGQITVSIHSGDDGTLSGTTEVDAVAGIATFTNVALAGLVSEDYVLRFTGSGLTAANSNVVNITPGPAVRLAITGSATQIAGTSQNLTITAYDSKGNVSTGYAGDKNLTFSGAVQSPNGTNPTVTDKDGSASNFGTPLAVTFVDGVATVSSGNNGVMTLYNVGSSTIAVQDQDGIAAAGGDRLTVNVTHGTLESFAVSLSSPQSSGSSFTETNTITARDSWGNTVTSFDASATPVTLTTSLSGTISGLGSGENNILNREGDFTNGVANVAGILVYTGATGNGTFTATAEGKSGTSSEITISAGTPAQIVVHAGNNQSATIGTALPTNPSVFVSDAANNPVQGISVTFSVTSGGGSLTDAVVTTNSDGIATVGSWTLGSNVGTNALSATITGSNPSISTSFSAEGLPVPDLSVNDQTTNDTTPTITGLSNQPEGTTITITLKDSEGNDIVDDNGVARSYTATVTSEGTWSIEITDELSDGEYTVTATLTDGAGNTITADGSLSINTTVPEITVQNTSTNSSTPTISGTSNQPEGTEVRVTINDSNGNPHSDDSGNPITYTTTVGADGSWSVNVTDALTVGEYVVTAEITDDIGNTGSDTGTLTIVDDTILATNVEVPGGRVGEVTSITITLSNQDGEPVLGASDRLNFGITGVNAGVELSGITDNGDGTYTVTYTPVSAGEDQISILLDGNPVDGSPFTSVVSPDDDERMLSFLQSPNESTEAGNQIGTIIVEALNSAGNRLTGFSGAVTIDITEDTGGPLATDAMLIGTTTVNAVNGVATFASIVMERAGVDYTLTATADDFADGISNPFEVTPGPPWELSIRERDDESDIITDFFGNSTQQILAAKGKSSVTMNNEALLEGNRIPMFMVILDEFDNITFVEEGDTEVEITSSSASGRFYLEQTASDPTNVIIIPRNQRFTNFYYEDPSPGQLIINGTPFPPPGARHINPGETPLIIRMPGRLLASPKETKADIDERRPILITLRDASGERVWAPIPGVTVNLSSSSITGKFYTAESGGEPIVSTLIAPATTSVIVYYSDSTLGTHTLFFEGEGVPNPNDQVQFTVEGGGELSQLIILGPDSLRAGEKGGTYRLVLQDEFQNDINTETDLNFQLNLVDGENTTLYRMIDGEYIPLANFELTIPAGKSNVPFYLSQTRAGEKILNAKLLDDEDDDLTASKPIYFTADSETIIMAMIAGNGQQDRIMEQLAENLKVTIIDQFENPITDREVTFSLKGTPIGASAMELMLGVQKGQSDKSSSGNSAAKFTSVPDVRVFTDSIGIAEATFILGDRSGDYVVEATSPGLEPVEFVVTAISNEYMLHQNYPNPFDNGTTIVYEVPEEAEVRIEVYDMIGRRVAVLVNETRQAGLYVLDFDANRYGLSSGVYVYRMIAKGIGNGSGYSMVRRLVYVK